MTDMTPEATSQLLRCTAKIVQAHVSNNAVAAGDLPRLLREVYESLAEIETPAAPQKHKPQPVVSIRESVTPEYLICLEDGRRLKMLKRYLMKHYGLTPEDYRRRWGLPDNYPMVAANYARRRSELAKSIGLGRKAGAKVKRSSA